MSWVLSEQAYYSVSGAYTALDYLRQFAVAQGWTVDYWTGGTYLQLYSPGYVNQEMCYRVEVDHYDGVSDIWKWAAVVPGYRTYQADKWNLAQTWGGKSDTYRQVDVPRNTFTALYLYGNDRFISMIWHINPIAVITMFFGTCELLTDWWYYPGLWFYHPVCQYSVSQSRWADIVDNYSYWYWPPGERHSSSYAAQAWFGGGPMSSNDYGFNYRPDNIDDIGDELGEFNNPKHLIRYNSFTDKRVAFQGTYFIRDSDIGVWYPVGNSPWAFVNGRDLSIGDSITFGTDTYKCFPIMFSTKDIWQAYRTA
jgi:hypothetical protein